MIETQAVLPLWRRIIRRPADSLYQLEIGSLDYYTGYTLNQDWLGTLNSGLLRKVETDDRNFELEYKKICLPWYWFRWFYHKTTKLALYRWTLFLQDLSTYFVKIKSSESRNSLPVTAFSEVEKMASSLKVNVALPGTRPRKWSGLIWADFCIDKAVPSQQMSALALGLVEAIEWNMAKL